MIYRTIRELVGCNGAFYLGRRRCIGKSRFRDLVDE